MATQLSTLAIVMIDVAVGLGCGVAAYLLSAYTTTTIVGGAATKITTELPIIVKETIAEAATAATDAATNQLEQTANNQIANATNVATNMTGDALSKAEKMAPTREGGLEMTALKSDALNNVKNTIRSQQDLLKNSLTDATSVTGGIPGLTQEDVQRRMEKMKAANINYQEGLKNASTSATNALKPFDKSKIKNFVPDQTNYTPGDVLNTVSRNRATTGGGRKTKNNRKKTVQPKVKKPRTKKCLITKGDKMFMSFCI